MEKEAIIDHTVWHNKTNGRQERKNVIKKEAKLHDTIYHNLKNQAMKKK